MSERLLIPSNIARLSDSAGAFPCPSCSGKTGVNDSRPSGKTIRRRRVCRSCGHRCTTFEVQIDHAPDFVPALEGLASRAAGIHEMTEALLADIHRILSAASFMKELDERRYGGAANTPTPHTKESL